MENCRRLYMQDIVRKVRFFQIYTLTGNTGYTDFNNPKELLKSVYPVFSFRYIH